MSALSLTTSYQQYKEDTNLVASWLASTARSCGYPKDLLLGPTAQNSGSKNPGRLKGKARKQTKQPGNSETASSAIPKRATVIAVKNFTTLAEFIAGKRKQGIKVPSYLAYTIDRAIRTRKEHGALASMRPGTESSNKSHSYFVGILERVKEVLAPIMPARNPHQPKLGAEPSADDISNRFENLNVEEPSQEFLNAPDVVFPERPRPEFEAEQLDDFDEVYTAFLLLLEDFRQIREVVNNLWRQYKDESYGLVALSLTTNTAIDFARALENDLLPLLNKHGGSANLLEKVWTATCNSHGQDPKNYPGEGPNLRMYKEAENIMWNAFHFLNEYKKIVGVGSRNVPAYKPGSFGVYDPMSDRESMTDRQKYDEDRALLMDYLPFVALHVKTLDKDQILEDELIRGCRIVLETGEISLWNVLAVQLFLDVHHNLRSNAVDAFETMFRSTVNLRNSLLETLDFLENVHIHWHEECKRALQLFTFEILLFMEDDYYQKHVENTPNWPKLQKHFIWRQHPVLCGLWMYRRQSGAQKLGVNFCNASRSVLLTCHLYHAVGCEKLLDREKNWKDMETLIEIQSESIFGERAPEGPDEYFRRYLLTMGTSAASLTKNRRRNWQHSKAGSRGLKEQTPLAEVFVSRYADYYYRYDFTPDHMKKILENTKMWEIHTPHPENDQNYWKDIDDSKTLRRIRRLPPKKSKQDGKALQRLTVPALLKNMCSALEAERKQHSFDYFRMHLQCWKLLRVIKEKCHPKLLKMYGRDYLAMPESALPATVCQIFLSAVNANNFPPEFAKLKRTAEVTSDNLVKAAEAIQEWIDRGEGHIVTNPQHPPCNCIDCESNNGDYDFQLPFDPSTIQIRTRDANDPEVAGVIAHFRELQAQGVDLSEPRWFSWDDSPQPARPPRTI